MDGSCYLPLLIALILIVILVLIFSDQAFSAISSTKRAVTSAITGKPMVVQGSSSLPDDDDDSGVERLNDPKITTVNPPAEVSATLDALGYTADAPWDEVLQATELDPSTFVNHMDFVKDVRRFSSGANFTSVTDDNTNIDFVNFRGLRRPEHVPIGAGARQVPDVDESVLQRNRPIRF
jgi:hypothetical protein